MAYNFNTGLMGVPKPAYGTGFTTTPTQPKIQQPTTNTNWASGTAPFDPKGAFSQPPKQTIVSHPNYNLTPGVTPMETPQEHIVFNQPPPEVGYTMDPVPPDPILSHPNYNLTPGVVDSTPTTNTNPPPAQGFNTQYATLGNIQPYMNPYLDQIIAKGTNAIEHSAASKGLFGSSGNINDIGTWATNAQSNAFQDARKAMMDDRGYMTDTYFKNRGMDSADAWKTNDFNWNTYTYGNGDYLSRLLGFNTDNAGIVGTGQTAANNVGGIYGLLGNALSGLYGLRGDLGMQGAVNSGNNNSGLLDGLMGLLSLGLLK